MAPAALVPALIIGGAPKCGTSTLFAWLSAHPEVSPSTPKETFFLMDRGHPLANAQRNVHEHGLEAYGGFFTSRPGGHLRVEATTHYLYQDTALEVLSGLADPPHVLFVLRRPGARVYSSYRYTANNLARLVAPLTFADYVRLGREDPEALARFIEAGPSLYVLSRDLAYSRYADYLARWRDNYPAARLHVWLFEQLVAAPEVALAELCGWLGLEPGFYESYDFPRRNETHPVSHHRLHRIARQLRDRVPFTVPAAMKRLYFAAQRGEGGVTQSDRDALRHLEQSYTPHNQKLAELFGLDLAPWAEA